MIEVSADEDQGKVADQFSQLAVGLYQQVKALVPVEMGDAQDETTRLEPQARENVGRGTSVDMVSPEVYDGAARRIEPESLGDSLPSVIRYIDCSVRCSECSSGQEAEGPQPKPLESRFAVDYFRQERRQIVNQQHCRRRYSWTSEEVMRMKENIRTELGKERRKAQELPAHALSHALQLAIENPLAMTIGIETVPLLFGAEHKEVVRTCQLLHCRQQVAEVGDCASGDGGVGVDNYTEQVRKPELGRTSSTADIAAGRKNVSLPSMAIGVALGVLCDRRQL